MHGYRCARNAAQQPLRGFAFQYEVLTSLIVVPWVVTCWMFGIYRNTRIRTPVDELQTLLKGVALGLLVVSAISFFFKELHFGRFVVAGSACLNLLSQGASRAFFHRMERAMRSSGAHDVPALIVGTGIAAIRLLQKLQDHPEVGYRVVGLLAERGDAEDEKDVAGHPVLGGPPIIQRIGNYRQRCSGKTF